MPTALVIVFTLALGFIVVCAVNASALMPRSMLRERYLKDAAAPGAVEVDAPDAVLDRVQARNRVALIVSALCTAAAAVALPFLEFPAIQRLVSVLLLAAAVPMLMTRALMSGERGAARLAGHTDEQPTIADYLPVGLVAALVAAQVVFLGVYVSLSLAQQPDDRGWVYAWAVASAVATAASLVVVVWRVRQPRPADVVGRYWADRLRTDDLVGLVVIGPVIALGVTLTAFTYGGPGPTATPVFPFLLFGLAYLVVLVGLIVALGVRAPRRMRQRLWPMGVGV